MNRRGALLIALPLILVGGGLALFAGLESRRLTGEWLGYPLPDKVAAAAGIGLLTFALGVMFLVGYVVLTIAERPAVRRILDFQVAPEHHVVARLGRAVLRMGRTWDVALGLLLLAAIVYGVVRESLVAAVLGAAGVWTAYRFVKRRRARSEATPGGSIGSDELRRQLLALAQRDLETRGRLLKDGTLFDGYHPEMEAVHRDHAQQLDLILDEHGWPGISRVGEDGEAAAWLIAQHAIGLPAFQLKCLAHLGEAVSRGDAPAWHRAYLQDRILFNQEKPQLYGAVWDWDENGELSTQVDDWGMANERRKAIGLPSLEEIREEHRRAVAEEGAEGPRDDTQYKRKQREWAKRAGWLSET